MRPSRVVYVLTHGGCTDGFGAMWAHYRGMLNNPPSEPTRVVYVPETHKWQSTVKLMERADLPSLDVIYADIAPERDLLVALHGKAKSVRVYDHHETAYRRVGDLPYCFFDMKRSGAGIMWDVFNPNKRRPKLIDYIEDGDLWRWKIPNSDKYLIVLETTRYSLASWDSFAADLEDPKKAEEILKKGTAYKEYRDIVTRKLLGHNKVHKLTLKSPGGGRITMPAVNASIFQSGLGNALALKPGPCAAIYYTQGKAWLFSLRSTDAGPNVAEVAEQYGGGGHRNASGFRVESLEQLVELGVTFEDYSDEEVARVNSHVSGFLHVDDLAENTFVLDLSGRGNNAVLDLRQVPADSSEVRQGNCPGRHHHLGAGECEEGHC